jgi:hypothetical protein
MEDIKSRILDTQSSTYEIDYNLDKFNNNNDHNDHNIGSPKSQSTSRSSKTFKELLNESFDDYINRIKNVKFYHY